MEARQLRPLGVGEILDAAINIYFRNLGPLWRIAAIVILPATVLILLLNLIGLNEVTALQEGAARYSFGDSILILDESTVLVTTLAAALVSLIAYLLVIGASFRAVSELYLGRQPDAGASLRYSAGRIHSQIWIGFLFVLGVGLGFIALILPGIWLLFAWSVAIPALMLEDKRGTKALGRSFDLVRHNWWRVFGALLVGFIFIALFEFLTSAATEGLGGLADDSVALYATVANLINALLTIFTAPLQAAIVTVVYYDLRVRKEAFDVEVLAANLETPGSASAPAAPAPGSQASPPPPPASTP